MITANIPLFSVVLLELLSRALFDRCSADRRSVADGIVDEPWETCWGKYTFQVYFCLFKMMIQLSYDYLMIITIYSSSTGLTVEQFPIHKALICMYSNHIFVLILFQMFQGVINLFL